MTEAIRADSGADDPNDPGEILRNTPMTLMQIVAVGVCVLLNALDGFDVLAISFAAPGIADEWGINRAALGVVLSMELIGMTLGSLTLGSVADSAGRRPTILGCLAIMVAGMFLAAAAKSVVILSAIRFVTGIGIGGMLASINAMAAEYSNLKFRSLSVTVMAAGYPLGVIVGGTIASMLLEAGGWRSVFIVGGVATVVFLPLVWFLLPESLEFLVAKQPANALQRINKTLKHIGHQTIEALPAHKHIAEKVPWSRLFSADLFQTTALLTIAYFANIMTFYFLMKWVPKIVVDMGFAPSAAGTVLVWTSVGGASGAIVLGLLSHKLGTRIPVILSLVIAFFAVWWFGSTKHDIGSLTLAAATAGFFTNAAVVGLYAIFVESYPVKLRAGGTGLIIGFGRGGAALGPIVAGVLLNAGLELSFVAAAMGGGAIVAALAVGMLPRHHDPVTTSQ
jgi:benzoate transport